MHDTEWRWADPSGQQRRIRLDELRAALASGLVAPNAPVWRAGWVAWREAREVPELSSSALSAEHGLLPNIPPPPLAVVAAQSQYEAQASGGPATATHAEPPPPPPYVPLAAPQAAPPGHSRPSAPVPAPPASAPKAAPSGPKLPDAPASAPKPEPASAPALRLTEVKGPLQGPGPGDRPWVRYEYADPALQALPAGSRILLRLSPAQAAQVKARLREFRAQVAANPRR